MTPDRFDELATFAVDADTPDDARISIPARDLRDLVALIPVARAVAEGARSDSSADAMQFFMRAIDALDALRGTE